MLTSCCHETKVHVSRAKNASRTEICQYLLDVVSSYRFVKTRSLYLVKTVVAADLEKKWHLQLLTM